MGEFDHIIDAAMQQISEGETRVHALLQRFANERAGIVSDIGRVRRFASHAGEELTKHGVPHGFRLVGESTGRVARALRFQGVDTPWRRQIAEGWVLQEPTRPVDGHPMHGRDDSGPVCDGLTTDGRLCCFAAPWSSGNGVLKVEVFTGRHANVLWIDPTALLAEAQAFLVDVAPAAEIAEPGEAQQAFRDELSRANSFLRYTPPKLRHAEDMLAKRLARLRAGT